MKGLPLLAAGLAVAFVAAGCGCQDQPKDAASEQIGTTAKPASSGAGAAGGAATAGGPAPTTATPPKSGDSELEVNPNANFNRAPGSAGR